MTRTSQIRFWLVGLTVFVVLLYLLRGVLLPFVAGMAVAYFLDPVADRLERLGTSRLAATTIITAGFFLAVVAVILLLLPLIQHQVSAFAGRVPAYLDGLMAWLEPVLQNLRALLAPEDFERLKAAAGDYVGTVAGWAATVLKGVLSGSLAVVNILSLIFITPIVTFYFLRDWDRMTGKVDSWLPRHHADTIRTQFCEIDRILSGFVRGQGMVVLFLAAYYGIGLSLVGLDLGLVVGIGAGLISFIPYLGTIVGILVGLALAFAQSPDWVLPAMVAGVFLVGQMIEGNFLTPKLVGDRVGLHPVWIIFALLAGAALFGFLGVLMAVPVAAVIGVLIRFSLGNYLNSPLYRGDAAHQPEAANADASGGP